MYTFLIPNSCIHKRETTHSTGNSSLGARKHRHVQFCTNKYIFIDLFICLLDFNCKTFKSVFLTNKQTLYYQYRYLDLNL